MSAGNSAKSFSSEHLHVFQRSVAADHSPNDMSGKYAKRFASGLPGVDAACLPDTMISRDEVLGLVNDAAICTATVCAAIMAWGGMQNNHRDLLFFEPSREWVAASERIRRGKVDRKSAYREFQALRDAGALPGMGPAYFTKLIYFLVPRTNDTPPGGYIMDQWAGCSVNLLAGQEVVLMDTASYWLLPKKKTPPSLEKRWTFTVSNLNTPENYEAFCQIVDSLALHFNITADEVDRALLSDGGRQAAPWRAYVIEHRRP